MLPSPTVYFYRKDTRVSASTASLGEGFEENPLAIELQEVGPFPLTLKDMFTNTHTVRVGPETKVFEIKELLRAAKGEPVEYVDAMALLYNQDTLDDDSTVGSHGLTEGTTVTLSMAQAHLQPRSRSAPTLIRSSFGELLKGLSVLGRRLFGCRGECMRAARWSVTGPV